ncbi:hypothetical protein FRC01_005609, partial [Tulasnella sp. 417]
MQGAPPSKKRKAEEDLDATATSDTRQDLAKLRARVATTDPATLRQFIVKKFDDAIESLAPRSSPHSPPLSTTTASASITSRPAASSASASSSTASSSPSHRRVGSRSGAVTTSPSTSSFVSSSPSTINALSTVFSDLTDNDLPPRGDPPPTPAATAVSSPTIPRSLPQPHRPQSLARDVHMASVSLPSRITVPSTPPTSVPGTSRTSDTLSKLQQGSRKQEEFEEELHCSLYPDKPQDPKAEADEGMYCFVGRHTTDEAEAASRKMNAYT